MKPFCLWEGCIVSVLFLIGGIVPLQAQDSLSCVSLHDSSTCTMPQDTKSLDDCHHLRLSNIVVPTMLTAASALCVNNGWLVEQRENVQDALSNKGKHTTEIDNYLQYSPMIAVYGLNMLGMKGKHSFSNRTGILAISYATMGILVNGMKYTFKEKRPDSNARNSFPSGHTATAFMGAEFMRQEYKDVSPWVAYSGYAVAIATGYLRIYNDRHYLNDVVAGACIGYMSTKFAYWLYPKVFTKSTCSKRNIAIFGLPFYNSEEVGFSLSATF